MKHQEEIVECSTSSPVKSGLGKLWEKLLSPRRMSGEEGKHSSSDYISSKCDDDGEMKRVFRYFDENGDGKVSPGELRRCMRTVGGEMSEEEAEMAVRLSDSDGDGMLGLEDFAKIMEAGEEGWEGEMRKAFGMYEMKGTGQITPKSLKRMLNRLGQSTSIKSCKAMIGKFDVDGDGVLSFDEFKIMMR